MSHSFSVDSVSPSDVSEVTLSDSIDPSSVSS